MGLIVGWRLAVVEAVCGAHVGLRWCSGASGSARSEQGYTPLVSPRSRANLLPFAEAVRPFAEGVLPFMEPVLALTECRLVLTYACRER